MALMKWDSRYSVGVGAMDAQHQKWFDILNRLHEAMLAGKAKDAQQSILQEMVSYTRNHFLQEEIMLKNKQYPVLSAHQQLHAAFTRKVQGLEAQVPSGESVLSADVMQFLKDWLQQHILQEDTKYGAWLKQH